MIWDWRLQMTSTKDIFCVLPKKRGWPFQKNVFHPVWFSTLSNFRGEEINKGTKQRYEKNKLIPNTKNCAFRNTVLCYPNAHTRAKKVNIPQNNYVKMNIFGLWNNFHHREHCKCFGKTVSCSNTTKLVYFKATKGNVLP